MSTPFFQEFKNAIHMSQIHNNIPHNFVQEFQQQRTKRPEKEIQSGQFGLSTFSRNFKNSEQKQSKLKQFIEGIGITIDDAGSLIIAQWKNNQIDGKYFLFKPNTLEQNNHNSSLCQYGFMRSGQLQGENYLYNNMGSLAKTEFSCNNLSAECYIIHNNKLFLASKAKQGNPIECQVIPLFRNGQSQANGLLKVPKITSIYNKTLVNNKITTNYQHIPSNLFFRPQEFIQRIIQDNRKKDGKDEILTYANINQQLSFVGFLYGSQKKTKINCTNRIKRDRINGFGAIFKNQWPLSYGTYKQGELQGLGRVYQTQGKALDGYFNNGQLIQGFVIDSYAKSITFGHHSSIDPQYKGQEHTFIVKNTFETNVLDCVIQYRRSFHLKSLHFNSSYFNLPKQLHRCPWPYNIMDRLNKKTHIESIIKEFCPSLRDIQISYIEKVNQNSDNRVEKELVEEIKEKFPSYKPSDIQNKPQPDKAREQRKFRKERAKKQIQKPNTFQDISPQKMTVTQKYDQQNYGRRKHGEQRLGFFRDARKSYVRQFRKQKNRIEENPFIIKAQFKQNRQKTNEQSIQQYIPQPKSNKNNEKGSINQIQSSYRHSQTQMSQRSPSKQISKKHTQNSMKSQTLSIYNQLPEQEKEDRAKAGKNNLTDLVNEYHNCETQRKKSISGNTTRRTRQLSTRRQSARQASRGKEGKYGNNRRKVNLNLIYKAEPQR